MLLHHTWRATYKHVAECLKHGAKIPIPTDGLKQGQASLPCIAIKDNQNIKAYSSTIGNYS